MNHDSRNIRGHYAKGVKTELDSENSVCSNCLQIIEVPEQRVLCPDCEEEERREYEYDLWEY